jgi:hypothetical protein
VEREEAVRAVKQEASLAIQSLLQENQRLREVVLRSTHAHQQQGGHGTGSNGQGMGISGRVVSEACG